MSEKIVARIFEKWWGGLHHQGMTCSIVPLKAQLINI